jgi:hypothetical protein
MKKIYVLFLSLFFVQCINAQNLALKIPADANAVATINAGKLSSLLPVDEWDKTSLGKMLGKIKGKDSSTAYNSVKDLGINLSGTIYYFHTENDSMHYNSMLIPLSDATKMEKLLGKRELIRLAGNVRKVTEDDSSAVFLWNEEQLLFVKASLKDAYFSTKEVAERNGLSYNYYYDEAAVAIDTSIAYSMDTTAVVIDSVTVVTDNAAVDSLMAVMEDVELSSDTTVEIMDDEVTYEGTFDYYNDISIKKRISAACASFTANEIFYKTPSGNILNNTSYVSSAKPDAIASLWVDKPMDMYYRLLPYHYFYGLSPLNNLSGPYDLMGYKSFSSHLTMNDKQMNIHSAIEMSGEIAAIQSKMMDRRINKQFYKYINTDSMLGYMSFAINTKNYLEAFPALLEKTYSNMVPGVGSEEYSLAAEFFSFLIDEEAIGNLVKGDMMVAFDGVFQQETTYTDYTYNDNFEQSAVEKTKNETIPRFLMMMSSEENNLARKLVKYGINKSVVKAREGFYEMEVPRSPMRFYFMYKNDIFFLTNSLQNIQAISTGSFKSNISKNEKKFIGDHNLAMYINPKNIAGKLVASGAGVTEELTQMINTFNKMGAVRMKINPVKNNTRSGDLWMDVPAGNSNALSLLLSFFDEMVK